MIIILHDKQFTSHETSWYCFNQKSKRNLKEQMNVISKIENPTPWCTGGSSEDLGFALTSNHSTTEGATSNSQGVWHIHSVGRSYSLPQAGGFWWIALSEESRCLNTSVTLKIPLKQASIWTIMCRGTVSTKRMNKIQEGLEGVVCLRALFSAWAKKTWQMYSGSLGGTQNKVQVSQVQHQDLARVTALVLYTPPSRHKCICWYLILWIGSSVVAVWQPEVEAGSVCLKVTLLDTGKWYTPN